MIDADTVQMIEVELERSYDTGTFAISSVQQHSNGFVVLFNVQYTPNEPGPIEPRIAFLHYISIEEENDSLIKKLDFIC